MRKIQFYVHVNAQDLQKASMSNFACERQVVPPLCKLLRIK